MNDLPQVAGMLFVSNGVQRDFFKNNKSLCTKDTIEIAVKAGDTRFIQWSIANGKRAFEVIPPRGIISTTVYIGFTPGETIPQSVTEDFNQIFYRLNGQIFQSWQTYLGAFIASGSIIFNYDSDKGLVEIYSGNSTVKFNYPPDTLLRPFIFYEEADFDGILTFNLSTKTCDKFSSDYKGWVD